MFKVMFGAKRSPVQNAEHQMSRDVIDPLLLEVALYRSWLIDQSGQDLDRNETEQLLRDMRAPERLRATCATLLALLDESMKPEHRATLKSLREKTGFDSQISSWLAQATAPRPT